MGYRQLFTTKATQIMNDNNYLSTFTMSYLAHQCKILFKWILHYEPITFSQRKGSFNTPANVARKASMEFV